MNTVFKPCLRRFVLVFFDDILVFSKALDEHIVDLKAILELLLNNHGISSVAMVLKLIPKRQLQRSNGQCLAQLKH